MESDPGPRDVIHDIVLADGEVVEILGANAGSSTATLRPSEPFRSTETNGPSALPPADAGSEGNPAPQSPQG